ncbi:MAG: amino acid ABC transporter permease [Betaproteobacteria bacterium]
MTPATGSDLRVILPLAGVLRRGGHGDDGSGNALLSGNRSILVAALACLLCVGVAEAYTALGRPSVAATLAKWTPLIAKGFAFNVAISIAAMAIGTVLGLFVGIAQISVVRPVRASASLLTQFFRNAPWLVLLFYCMLLLPFQIRIGGIVVPLPDWLKATFGLSLAVAANMSELTRGALLSIPSGQWESAESLGFTRFRSLWVIILPQCIKRILPSWMNLYALLLVSTPLCSIVGVNEVVTLTADALASESRNDLLVPMYLYILAWFFMVCYPLARWTLSLERRFAVKG